MIGELLSILHVASDVSNGDLYALHVMRVHRVDMKALRRDADKRVVLILINHAHGLLGVHKLRFQAHLLGVDLIVTAISIFLFREGTREFGLKVVVPDGLGSEVFRELRVQDLALVKHYGELVPPLDLRSLLLSVGTPGRLV